ncbi:MAG: FAD-binding oxidoreductase [Bacteroidota bacterium]
MTEATVEKLPYLVVGQGIAGTMLCWFLKKSNQPFIVIDNEHKSAASMIAAGIINPITGRRFVKSWMIEEFLPFAKETYQEMERTFGIDVWTDRKIIRFFANNAEGNNWLAKTTWDGYGAYLDTTKNADYLTPFIFDKAGQGTVNGAQVDLGTVISTVQKQLQQEGLLINQQFDYQQLVLKENRVVYQNIIARKVIFCEGYAACRNPYFAHLPYESAKGEALILRIPNLVTDDIIKKHFFLVPLEKDLFWFGANYEWDDLSEVPTQTGKEYLIEQLKGILKLDYEIVHHVAAVRPVLKDRRPALGLHPTYPQIALLNGMGTKGTSIAPYWAKQLVDFLVNRQPLSSEVAVSRFPIPSMV